MKALFFQTFTNIAISQLSFVNTKTNTPFFPLLLALQLLKHKTKLSST